MTLGAEDSDPEKLVTSDNVVSGAMWSLLGAFCYALYLVFLKKSVGPEGQLSVPMFFGMSVVIVLLEYFHTIYSKICITETLVCFEKGFVGLFSFSLLWPGMVALHYLSIEKFQLPDKYPAIVLVINGLIGTVISELLWLW